MTKMFISEDAKEFGFHHDTLSLRDNILGGSGNKLPHSSNILKFIERENKKLYNQVFSNKILPVKLTIDPKTYPKLKYFNINPRYQDKSYQDYYKFVHIGQRKLGMCEIQHLTEMLDTKDEYAIVIYAGSAPTNKGWMEHIMFPNVKFFLVDPNMYNIFITDNRDSHYYHNIGITYFQNSKTNYNYTYEIKQFSIQYFDGEKVVKVPDKYADSAPDDNYILGEWQSRIDYFYNSADSIFITENFFTNDTARFCAELIKQRKGNYANCKVLFWSDLRTSTGENTSSKTSMGEGAAPTDLDILWNLTMMYNWLKIIKPHNSMLKFRCPFRTKDPDIWDYSQYDEDFQLAAKHGHDFVEYYKRTGQIKYFPGTIYLQCWEGRHSAETRLWVSDVDNLVKYDRVAFEESLFYYNCIERVGLYHQNPYVDSHIGLDRCNDCAIEGHIWNRYKEKMDNSFDVKWWINWLSEITAKSLTRAGHGYF